MTDNEFLLFDRLEKIKATVTDESKFYISYSGGKKLSTIRRYLGEIPTKNGNYLHGDHSCPLCLKYQFEPDFTIPISDKCCYYLKKAPFKLYSKHTGRYVKITGMIMAEGGVRAFNNKCVLQDKDGKIKAFNPLFSVTKDWEDWLIEKYQIPLPKLYYSPYNFRRTGCKGCPFSLDLQFSLDTMQRFMPSEKSNAK